VLHRRGYQYFLIQALNCLYFSTYTSVSRNENMYSQQKSIFLLHSYSNPSNVNSGTLAFHFALYKTVVALNIMKRGDSATRKGLSASSNSGVELLATSTSVPAMRACIAKNRSQYSYFHSYIKSSNVKSSLKQILQQQKRT
jgi:hypothetical protein